MKQSQIIFRFLFPPRQYAAKAVHPAMRPLYNPAAGLKAGLMLNGLSFLAARTNMSGISKLFHQVSHLTRIIALIKTHALFFSFSRLWPFYRNTFYSSLRHSAIMPISAINRKAHRYSRALGKQTAFNAFFSPVRRVWTCFFPRQAGLLSWHHPSIATTSQYLSVRHNLPELSSIVSEKPRLLSIPEIVNGPCCLSRCRFHSRRSIDNRFVIQKESRPLPFYPTPSVCHRQNDACSDVSVSMARSLPIIRLKSYIYFLFSVFSSLNPFKGTIAFDYIGYSEVIRIGSKCCTLYFATSLEYKLVNYVLSDLFRTEFTS